MDLILRRLQSVLRALVTTDGSAGTPSVNKPESDASIPLPGWG